MSGRQGGTLCVSGELLSCPQVRQMEAPLPRGTPASPGRGSWERQEWAGRQSSEALPVDTGGWPVGSCGGHICRKVEGGKGGSLEPQGVFTRGRVSYLGKESRAGWGGLSVGGTPGVGVVGAAVLSVRHKKGIRVPGRGEHPTG